MPVNRVSRNIKEFFWRQRIAPTFISQYLWVIVRLLLRQNRNHLNYIGRTSCIQGRSLEPDDGQKVQIRSIGLPGL